MLAASRISLDPVLPTIDHAIDHVTVRPLNVVWAVPCRLCESCPYVVVMNPSNIALKSIRADQGSIMRAVG